MFSSASAPVPTAGTAPAGGGLGSGGLRWPALPRPRIRVGARAARASIAVIGLATVAVVLVATSGPSVLVPRSTITFPAWMAGPLNGLIPLVSHNPQTIGIGYTVVLVAMFGAYLVLLGSAQAVSLRLVLAAVGALELILLLGPPLQLNDVFNYLGYARLGALHDLNPYTHVIRQEFFDPVYRFSSWHNLRSPYGSLFSAITYPLAYLPLPVAYWLLKLITVAMSGVFLALVWRCAGQLGRDPRFALVFVAFNPIFLLYAVGGFHNDFFMLVPSMGAISLMLDGRDRSAGAAIVLAIAVKFTAVLLLPFLLVAAATRPRQRRILSGAALCAVPMIALSLAMFGLSLPNLVDQSALLTDFSIPNLVGDLIGAGGGAPWLLKVADVAVVAVVIFQLQRRREWMAGAAWSTFALLASLAWLVPWYVIWLLPLAVLAGSVPLRRVAIGATAFLIFAFMPGTGLYFSAHGVNLLSGQAGQASRTHQHKLSQ
ncbi:MAG TPA: glycosyltransferase family 87 protein [Solirubrobacteraceae bacterium]|nr:glycosyltransferase family 87 protein [Solirubrobacteraceae bacterium]